MAKIARLGHVGIHVDDLERAQRFYRDVLGLTVTDEDPAVGMVFLSARPEEEHHELVLCAGRTAPRGFLWLQQVSFRCDALDDVVAFYRRLQDTGVPIDMVVSHGNAVGVYFYDPEGNRVEVYWATGLQAHQPYLEGVDLTQPPEVVFRQVAASVAAHAGASYVDSRFLAAQDLGPRDAAG